MRSVLAETLKPAFVTTALALLRVEVLLPQGTKTIISRYSRTAPLASIFILFNKDNL